MKYMELVLPNAFDETEMTPLDAVAMSGGDSVSSVSRQQLVDVLKAFCQDIKNKHGQDLPGHQIDVLGMRWASLNATYKKACALLESMEAQVTL